MKDLLLLLSHYPYDPANRETIRRLLGEVKDWDIFVKLVNSHGIIALSAYNIKEAKLEKQVPEKAMAMLENGLMQSVVRNAWLAERWKEMNEILLKNGIRHILLKGMALEHTIYEAKGLRQMTDNDILISQEESMKAWNILKQNGFEPAEPKSRLHRKIMFDIGQHMPALIRDGYAVEIHTEPDFIQNKAATGILNLSEEFMIGGSSALKLKNDLHLRFLKEHLNRHAGAGECQLRSLADIKILEPSTTFVFPEEFYLKPDQKNNPLHRRTHYSETVRSVKKGYRLRFIAGDIFPSVKWMRKRYGCGTLAAVIRYPQRLGKLVWLL